MIICICLHRGSNRSSKGATIVARIDIRLMDLSAETYRIMEMLVGSDFAELIRLAPTICGRVNCPECSNRLWAEVTLTGTVRCGCGLVTNLPDVARKLGVDPSKQPVRVSAVPAKRRRSPGAPRTFPRNAGWDHLAGRSRGKPGRQARLRR